MLKRDHILVYLNWRDLTYTEIANLMGVPRQSVAVGNAHNMAVGFCEWTTDAISRDHSDRMRITKAGRDRLLSAPISRPKHRNNRVRDDLRRHGYVGAMK